MTLPAVGRALPLEGRRIAVTRPAERSSALCAAIEAQGGSVIHFPVLAIFDAADPSPLRDIAARLEEFDVAVFVSPIAAEKALAALTANRPWPARVKAAAMGETSARAIAQFGVAEILIPSGRSDSEALLERDEFQSERIRGRKVAIFRGDGGREVLGETLKARGADVEYVECYRRGRPDVDSAPLLELWARGMLDAVTVTSSEGLRNLIDMIGAQGAQWLRKTPLFVAHERIAAQARKLGCGVVVATAPGDEGLLAGLLDYFGGKRERA